MVNIKNHLTELGKLLKLSLKDFTKNDPLRMAAATAFFTTFALPPILIILTLVLSLLFNPQDINDEIYESLSGVIGRNSTEQVVDILVSIKQMADNWWVTIGGFVFLLFVATTLFKVIKSSINQIWRLRSKKKMKLLNRLRTRGRSILVIIVAGILFVLGLVAEAAQAFLAKYIQEIAPNATLFFNLGINLILSIIIVTTWFAVMFRYLPDSRPPWKVVFVGGFFTSILFNLGKFLLRWLLSLSNIDTIYGTSASIVLLLLFVFYSSFILYFGASFTKVWSERNDLPIEPLPHAAKYKISEVEEE